MMMIIIIVLCTFKWDLSLVIFIHGVRLCVTNEEIYSLVLIAFTYGSFFFLLRHSYYLCLGSSATPSTTTFKSRSCSAVLSDSLFIPLYVHHHV